MTANKRKRTSKKKKSVQKASVFAREFSALTRRFQALSPGNRKAAELRKKIYNLMSGAVLNGKTKKLTTQELDRMLDFMRSDTCAADNDQFERAVAVLEKLAEENNIQACVILADLYAAQYVQPPAAYRKHSRALILYETIGKGKDRFFAGYAHYRLAIMRAKFAGGGGDADGHNAVALKHAEKSAYDCDSPYGLVTLGCWYYDAQIVEKDWKKSHKLFKRAYDIVKDPDWHDPWIKWEAYFHYGYMVMHGEGCAANKKRGHKLLKESAAHDNPSARDWLARYEGTPDAPATTDNNPMASFAQNRKKRAKVKTKKQLTEMLKPLHAMIGCAPVKREIESLVYLAHANALRLQKKIDTVPPNLHAAFLGAPGTGKTTVARMYGQLLHELGFLTGGHLVEATRADLIAEYIGQTAPKVRAMVEKAVGGVLFIDEAYSLIPEDGGSWDFGPEAIAELIQQMENRRNNLVVVFAGYTDQMKMFLKTNPGLKSRVPGIVEFPDYSAEEMVRIFEKFCEEARFTVKPEALPLLAGYLKKLDKESVRRMGNARGIRNIFEDSIMRQSRRVVREGKTSKKALMTIEAQDIHLPGDPGKGIFTVIRGGKKTDS